MQSKNGFVAGLFVFAFCALLVGGMNLYKNVDFWLHSQDATMELADPNKKIVRYSDVLSTRPLDVKYVSEAGEVIVPQKPVSHEIVEKLVAGEKIPITYLTNDPRRTFNRYQRPPSPWAWLAVGLVTLAVAFYALRLRKREAGE